MNGDLRRQIYENMDLRGTDDLLEVWRTNDRLEWSDEAFDAIHDILGRRGVQLPEQGEPVLEHDAGNELEDATYGLSERELRIIDDENPPEFYDPFQVIDLSKWLDIAAVAAIVVSLAWGLTQFQGTLNTTSTFLRSNIAGILFAVLIVLVGVALQVAITYFPLRALAHVLRILMEMEFNSRRPASAPQPAAES